MPMGTTLREVVYDIGGGIKNGKEFKCWKVGDDEKNAGDKITVSSDITVKAIWKDKSSGGSNNIGLIIGGVIAGIVVVGAVAFFLIKRP